jgi:hypothetical protein
MGANVNYSTPARETPLRLACSNPNSGDAPRDPDPNGTRRLNGVKTLLRLNAGTSAPGSPPPRPPAPRPPPPPHPPPDPPPPAPRPTFIPF